ncbi:MAG TPA: phosphatidylglycerophosphatase A [Pirellulales bacterium]|nr:phosphatidylglycerophosphatase A [Pirellulales bacterium]
MPEDSSEPLPASRNPLRLGFAVWLATGFWIGFIPFAPGTWGTLWGIPLAWGVSRLPNLWMQAAAIAAVCAAGIPICTIAARRLGGRKDPGAIVLDEIASLPITFLMLPLEPVVIIAGFLLHRFFDILKPQPARALERLPDGFGIMADDWIAGIYSNLALHLLVWWNPAGLFAW